ncbi:unnamed protein product [marine sediment metagenome]|uniref:Uncharacterized protein n=1 Tax=marine sediment metagenome TaxID=412755 RepID=X1H9T8_9ZZZZ
MSKKKKDRVSELYVEVDECTLNIRKENERHAAAMKKLQEKRDETLKEYKQIKKKGGK